MKNFVKREQWTRYIKNNTHNDRMMKKEIKNTIAWCKRKKVSYDELYNRIQIYVNNAHNQEYTDATQEIWESG